MRNLNVTISGNASVILPGEASSGPVLNGAVQQLEQMLADQQKSHSTPDDWNEGEEEHETMEQNGILFDPCDVVAVVHPSCGISAMTVEESRSVLDVFEGDGVICNFPLLDLQMTFSPNSVTVVEGRKYLIGTAVVFTAIGRRTVSLDGEEIHLAKRILEESCKTICYQGQMVKALLL